VLQDAAFPEDSRPTEAAQTLVHKREIKAQNQRGSKLQGHNTQIVENRRDLQTRKWIDEILDRFLH